jgi:hypothetical protein
MASPSKARGSRPELPADHPARRLQRPGVRLTLLLLSPFAALALALWGVAGWLLTRPPRVVAATLVLLAWVLYVCIPHIPVRLVDFPAVLTVGLALSALLPSKAVDKTKKPAVWTAHLAVWLAVLVYGIVRLSLTSGLEPGTTQRRIVDALVALCCIAPAWVSICSLRLWLPADDQVLEEVERKVYEQYIVSDFSLLKVAGLGTVHVPYCGDGSRLPPRTLVLVHGYMAGNGFWAAVSICRARVSFP